MAAHAQVAFIGLALGFLCVHYLAERLGSLLALIVGLLVCIAWSGMLLVVRLQIMRRASPIAP
jgi:hypothetical protein